MKIRKNTHSALIMNNRKNYYVMSFKIRCEEIQKCSYTNKNSIVKESNGALSLDTV